MRAKDKTRQQGRVEAQEREPVVHPYARISDPEQRQGGGLQRQTTAENKSGMEEFARQFGFKLSKRIRVDDGVSAWKGLNATPQHELGKFLVEAQGGLIPPGDCLLLENWDRLSRQDIWAAIGLVNDLRQLGIHVGRLDRMKLLRCDSTDPGDFFEAAVELMRGHSESAAKSDRNGKAWTRKRAAARENGTPVTRCLPAWVEEVDGELRLMPARAAVLKRIFHLAGSGYGGHRISSLFIDEGVPPFGRPLTEKDVAGWPKRRERQPQHRRKPPPTAGEMAALRGHVGELGFWKKGEWSPAQWNATYIRAILSDRRALGEYQPRRQRGRVKEGGPIPGYFPVAVTRGEWDRARAGVAERRTNPGRTGEGPLNPFASLLRSARDGSSYYRTVRPASKGYGTTQRILINSSGVEGGAVSHTFPYDTFEAAVLEKLAEIDPHEILNGDQGPDETKALRGEFDAVDAELAEASAYMDAHGFSPTIGRRVTALEARKADLAEKLAAAREKAAHPLSETWGEAQTLMGALKRAADQTDARLRLRSALRRMVESVWLQVVGRGMDRLCAVQIWFAGGQRHRDYLILHRPPRSNGKARKEGGWRCWSLADVAKPGDLDLDLRRRADARELEAALQVLDVSALLAGG
jgi:DNA invertase Pin-like site-specific DNA recombinase